MGFFCDSSKCRGIQSAPQPARNFVGEKVILPTMANLLRVSEIGNYTEHQFHCQVKEAMKTVENILATTRLPQYPASGECKNWKLFFPISKYAIQFQKWTSKITQILISHFNYFLERKLQFQTFLVRILKWKSNFIGI